nr:hypothetical protein [Thermoanaerobaculia bacterium]
VVVGADHVYRMDFAQMVETHEEVHVADLKQTIQEILRPWDERLQRLQREEFRVTAPSRQAAEAALYEQAGGTPSEVGQRFVEALRYKGKAFHRTATGASPTIVSVEKSLLGGTLYVNLRHPVGLAELHRAKLERRREEELRRRALDRAIAIWTYNRSQGVVSINTSGEGNRYILNEML